LFSIATYFYPVTSVLDAADASAIIYSYAAFKGVGRKISRGGGAT